MTDERHEEPQTTSRVEGELARLRATEEALRKNEELLGQAVRVADIGIFDHDMVREEIYWSPRLREIFGFAADRAITLDDYTASITPEQRGRVVESVERALDPRGDGSWEVEHAIVRGGEVAWITARSKTFFEGEGDARRAVRTVGAVREITARVRADEERARLQSQLAHAQKLESVGRLAGGVAHDFNNMLSVILGHVEVSLAELHADDPLRPDLEEIQRAAQRSAELTNQLLAFARRQAVSPRVLDLNDAVERSLKMLRRLIGESIELVWAPGRDLWPVRVDPSQVDQILANLAVNARDAIGGVGRVTISTQRVEAGEGDPLGDCVRLTVRDDGAGMDADTLAHVFEPFFTTKPDGRGTGLGLATVYGIVKQNGGHIDVSSRPGEGTTVTVLLPRSARDVASRSSRPPPRLAKGRETLLLVEDEPMVLHVTRTLLERLGYTVVAAPTPREALRIVSTRAAPFDLLVTDVTMPEMNGGELYRRVVALQPNLPCLFVSAHPSRLLSDQGLVPEGVHMLQKPFTIGELGARVREALTATP